jgi:hypothetical protein
MQGASKTKSRNLRSRNSPVFHNDSVTCGKKLRALEVLSRIGPQPISPAGRVLHNRHALGFRQMNGRGGDVSPLCSWAPALAPVHREAVATSG